MQSPRVTAPLFRRAKSEKRPLVVVTAYDFAQAALCDAAGVDAILVGDSLGMTTLGHATTIPVTLDDMIRHTRAVSRGTQRALLIADLPFGAYGVSVEDGVRAGVRLVAEGGAQAVKLEGAGPVMLETIRRLVDLGVPVMGHLGMTPQSVNRFGGFKVQGKSDKAADAILSDAVGIVAAGVFAFVLEVIPAELSRRITGTVPVPTIGIGAGPDCDGQVQVFHDLVGLFPDEPVFKHARRYVEAGKMLRDAVAAYAEDVRAGRFPTEENAF